MNYLLAENISKSYGERVLFENLTLSISQGQKIALVARNGAGKSSLMKILTGKDTPDAGGEVRISKDITMGYLEQEPQLDENQTIMEAIVTADNPMLQAIKAYEEAMELSAEDHSPKNQQLLQDAMNKMDALKAWDYELKMKQILTHLNITNLSQNIGSLSGGQKKRVALAKLLVQEPDFMIMDEPTNHLDLDMIEWLEDYMKHQKMTLLLVTHDRYFLDRVSNEILELDNGQLYRYKGNYEYYLEKKAEREFSQGREVEKARNLMRKELDWMRRQPKARGTKSKSRIDAFYDLQDKASQKTTDQGITINVKMSRVGGKILELKHINKSYGNLDILKGFTYTFAKGEKIGIVGPNGVGKTTFLNILTGKEQPDSGKINVGDTTVFGYYTQEGIKLPEDKRVIEVVKDIAEVIPLGTGENLSAAQFLQYFGFEPNMQFTFVSKLSGGERRRLHLMTVLIKNPNFLILDEPTNDLDIITLNTLEEFLINFQGCLLIVSHDRYFMDKLADHLFVFEGNGIIKDFNGNYSDYRDIIIEEEKQARKGLAQQKQESALYSQTFKAENTVTETVAPAKKKMTYKEKREFEMIEKDIEDLENRKAELENKMNTGQGSHEDFKKWGEELGKINSEIEAKTDRWIELSEMAE